jgi:hypothetical protein
MNEEIEIIKQLIIILGIFGVSTSSLRLFRKRNSFKTKKEKRREIGLFFNSNLMFLLLVIMGYYFLQMQQDFQGIVDNYTDSFKYYITTIEEKNRLIGALSSNCTELVNNYTDCMNNTQLIDDMPFIEAAKNYTRNLTYDRKYFNCLDFNKGCVALFQSLGYNAYIMAVSTIGNTRPSANHAITIIELPIDCTEGLTIIPPKKFEFYGVK